MAESLVAGILAFSTFGKAYAGDVLPWNHIYNLKSKSIASFSCAPTAGAAERSGLRLQRHPPYRPGHGLVIVGHTSTDDIVDDGVIKLLIQAQSASIIEYDESQIENKMSGMVIPKSN